MATNILPGTSKAVLTLANGQMIPLGKEAADSTIITDGTQINASGSGVTYASGGESESIVYNKLEIPRGGEFCLTLSDGTFNIRAYPEEKQSQATLAEGSVRIYSPGSSMLLKPGEQAEVNALSGEMVKREVEVKSFTSWKDGRFVFEQQPLEDIMRTLERWYDIRVIFKDEGAKRISLSGNMKRYGDFSQVMKMLQMTGDVRFELHGNDVYITTE